MGNTKAFFTTKNDWSKHKDKLLERYILPYLTKVMKTGKEIVCIDGFAGIGKFDDGTNGSPLIIKEAIYKAKSISTFRTPITSYFIEYEHAEELKSNLSDRNCNVIAGDYRLETPKILANCKDKNVFLYVDPFGIKYLDFDIFKKLKIDEFKSIELLLNFNSFGFIREACRLLKYKQEDFDDELPEVHYSTDNTKNTIENMIKIANGNYWIDIVKGYNDGKYDIFVAEELFLNLYIQELKKVFNYVYYIPIKKSKSKLAKYQMIFATNHRDGAMLMADNMIKCNNEMQLQINNGQGWLFDYNYNLNNIESDVLNILDSVPINLKDFYHKVYNSYGFLYLTSDINNKLKELESKDEVIIDRYPPTTKNGKKTTSMDLSKHTIKVRRKSK